MQLGEKGNIEKDTTFIEEKILHKATLYSYGRKCIQKDLGGHTSWEEKCFSYFIQGNNKVN